MVRQKQGLPKSVKYCLWANRITLLLVLAVILGFGYKQYSEIQSQSTSPNILSYVGLVSGLMGSVPMFVTFAIWILGLNSKLKRLDEKAMTWQVFWSFLFIFAVPVGTLLHLPCLFWMLFSRDTFEAFEEGAWNDPKPFKGVVIALFTIMIFGGGAYFVWSQRDMLNDLKDMNPLAKMTGASGFNLGDLGKEGGIAGIIGGDTMNKINKSADGSKHVNAILSDLGIGEVGGDPMEALGRKSMSGGSKSAGGGSGKMSTDDIYKKLLADKKGGAGGLSSLLGSSKSDVKKPFAMKPSKASLVKLNQAQKTLPERFFEWLDKMMGKEEIRVAPVVPNNPVVQEGGEDTLYDQEAGNLYF